MSRRTFASTLMLGLSLATPAACASDPESLAGLQVWLLEADDCGACRLYQSFGDGYPTQLRGYPGSDAPIPVSVIDKSAIPASIAAQFQPHDYWSQSLSVMVLDDGKVLHVGNIAEASDIAHARFPAAIMTPANAAERERAAHPSHFYGEYFRATWKLDYFVDVALGKRPLLPSLKQTMLGETLPLDGIGSDNLILWGSAGTPSGNALYLSERMQGIRTTLQELAGPSLNVVALYGNGDDPAPDTSVLVDGEVEYVQSDIDTPHAADGDTLARLFHGLRGSRRNLLVQIGHSGPTGAPLWGQLATVDAPLLETLVARSGSDLVMVSGACNGGQFAEAPSCGFFAAHPQVVATGCQKSPQALRGSDDYLGLYFGGINDGQADLDGDGVVSFSEAHWYAAVAAEDHQIPYDSTDVQVDAFWQAQAGTLPAAIGYARLRELARQVGRDEERWAVEQLATRIDDDTRVTTTGMLAINAEALDTVAGMTEASSTQRNAAMALDYPLVLSALARRLLWRERGAPDARSSAVASCGDRSVKAFLGD